MNVALTNFEIKRADKMAREIIENLNLDLSGLTVLTEVGSRFFSLTPVIALMAGADQVFAWTRDSIYGSASDVISNCEYVIECLGVPGRVEFAANTRPREHVGRANIITNSGFVRPLDRELLSDANKGNVAIPLMYEKWELRESEIDIPFCREMNIPVGGTWENHPSLKVFDYCGNLAAKICFEAGLEVRGNRAIVWSSDDFGRLAAEAFQALGAEQVTVTVEPTMLLDKAKHADFIFFCDFHEQRPLLGEGGIIDIDELIERNPAIKIVHLMGWVDAEFLRDHSIDFYPEMSGKPQTMTRTLAHLGPGPLIKLQTGGLRVAECLLRSIKDPICQRIV